MGEDDFQEVLVRHLAATQTMESLFDCLPDVVFFVKDVAGRYVLTNQTLVERCGVRSKTEMLGLTTTALFPPPLGTSYAAQDRSVLEAGLTIRDRLELHFYANGRQGWCLTYKFPLRCDSGEIIGMTGISRDLHDPDERHVAYHKVARAVSHLQTHYAEPLTVGQLAASVGLSVDQFGRLVKRIFHLSPQQLLKKTRFEAASRLLEREEWSIAEVAYACGYSDQSAFTRQFKATAGATPSEFRRALRRSSA